MKRSEEIVVLEPTGWVFLGLLAVAAAGSIYWVVVARPRRLRATVGALAFTITALLGLSLVNAGYGYYGTWGDLFSGAAGTRTVQASASTTAPVTGTHHARGDGPGREALSPAARRGARQVIAAPAGATIGSGHGQVLHLDLPGARSGLDRQAYVYLPPQYRDPRYASVRFPVIELLHGQPGNAAGWIYGLTTATYLDEAIDSGHVGPMIAVMPTTYVGGHGQDCTNVPGGPADDTYLAADVPADMQARFRVLPQGRSWAIGGLSDGGFCAANLALRHPGSFGAVMSMDGFYTPAEDPPVFGHDPAVARANDPLLDVESGASPLPHFWIMYGTNNETDVAQAQTFAAALEAREPIQLVVVPGGQHTTPAWRAVMPAMLLWTWNAVRGGPIGTGQTHIPLTA